MKIGYLIYMFVVLLLILPVYIFTFLAPNFPGLHKLFHELYHPLCHQLDQRSLCYFPESGQLMANCLPEGTEGHTRNPVVFNPELGEYGYKFLVCSRDVAIYTFAALAGLFILIMGKADEEKYPHPIFFLLLILPLALDGTTQLIGLRESTNQLRIITGALAGIAMSIYTIPLLNSMAPAEISVVFSSLKEYFKKKIKRN